MTQVLLEQFPRGVVRQVRLQRGIWALKLGIWHAGLSPQVYNV